MRFYTIPIADLNSSSGSSVGGHPGVLAVGPELVHGQDEHEAVEREENQDGDVEENLNHKFRIFTQD